METWKNRRKEDFVVENFELRDVIGTVYDDLENRTMNDIFENREDNWYSRRMIDNVLFKGDRNTKNGEF